MTSDKAFVENHFNRHGFQPAGKGQYVSEAYKFRGHYIPFTSDFLKKAFCLEPKKPKSPLLLVKNTARALTAWAKGDNLAVLDLEAKSNEEVLDELNRNPNEQKKGV